MILVHILLLIKMVIIYKIIGDHRGVIIIFDTDMHGYVKGWKEKNIKQKKIIIEECITNKY